MHGLHTFQIPDINSLMNANPITITATIQAPISKVWEYWSSPEHITKWAFADGSWEAPHAENDLQTGGKFLTRMQAKDKSGGFDFGGVYTDVVSHKLIEYDMDKGENEEKPRHVKIEFEEIPTGVKITQTFDPEQENPSEMQKAGWQTILNNFKKYTEEN